MGRGQIAEGGCGGRWGRDMSLLGTGCACPGAGGGHRVRNAGAPQNHLPAPPAPTSRLCGSRCAPPGRSQDADSSCPPPRPLPRLQSRMSRHHLLPRGPASVPARRWGRDGSAFRPPRARGVPSPHAPQPSRACGVPGGAVLGLEGTRGPVSGPRRHSLPGGWRSISESGPDVFLLERERVCALRCVQDAAVRAGVGIR